MKIEFKPVERDCPHNQNIKAGKPNPFQKSQRPIVDFDIVIDCEKRAEFRMAGPDEQGYYLHLLTGVRVEIPRKDVPRRACYIGGERAFQYEFELVVSSALSRGEIPSVEVQLQWTAQADTIKQQKNDVAWAKYCGSWLRHRMGEKADEIMHLLTNVDKSSETAWHSWLSRRDQLVHYITQQPPKDEVHMLAAGIKF